jgi:phosphonate utilization associated putative membrane protein
MNPIHQAYLAIGGSVLMHVAWNLLVRQQHGKTELLWWALAAHCVTLGPWAIHALVTEAQWTPVLVASLVVSAASNTFYFLVLNRAYAHAPVALVYPIARSSPLLIALWGALFFGEALAGPVWAALAVIVAGLLLLATTAWRGDAAAAVPLALAAALATSIYSLSDKLATRHLPSFASLLGFITIGYATSWLALTLRRRRSAGRWRPLAMPRVPILLVAGLCIGVAYALVIHAMRGLPAAVVVGFTNAGIVVAGVLSMSVFRERAHWPMRLTGIAVMCLGLTLLAAGR